MVRSTALLVFCALALYAQPPPTYAADPKALYQGICIACHGPHAEGAIPGVPNLAKTGRLSKPTGTLVNSVLNGMQTPGSQLPMPAKGGNPTLTPADAAALVTYMRTLVPSK